MSHDTLSLFSELMQLKTEHEGVKLANAKLSERELLYQGEIEWLKEQLIRFQRNTYGPKKEHWQSEEQDVLVFNEAETEAKNSSEQEEEEAQDSDEELFGQ